MILPDCIARWIFATVFTAAIAVGLSGCGGGGGTPPATVTGRVLLVSSGDPLAAATVTVGSSGGGGASIATLTTGIFTITGASSASTTITVAGTGIKTLTETLAPLVPNTINSVGDIYVLTSDAATGYNATASGVVVRADTQAPITGAIVSLNGQLFTTTATGAFHFAGLPVGLGNTTGVGTVRATGFEDKPIIIDPPLGPPPGNNDLGNIPMSLPVGGIPPGPSDISGKVTVPAGADNSGSIVTLVNKSNGQTVGTATTPADGTYGFWVLAGTYTVTATHSGFPDQHVDVTVTRPDVVQTANLTM